jgi:hypothetical protein
MNAQRFPGTPELRKKLKDHYRKCDRIMARYEQERETYLQKLKAGRTYRPVTRANRVTFVADVPEEPRYPDFPPEPAECANMTCGAKTRAGTPCKRFDLYPNGRCKFHGGMSTGPRTPEGKKRSAQNGLRRRKGVSTEVAKTSKRTKPHGALTNANK